MQPYIIVLAEELLILESVDLSTFVVWAMSRKDRFPFLRRRRALFRLFAFSRHFLQRDLSDFDLSAHRMRHPDLLGYTLEGH